MITPPLPQLFVISLKNSSRREVIKSRLDALNISFSFFDAVNGKALTEDELSQVDFSFYTNEIKSKKPLTLGEVGCAMSHINLYEYIVKNGIAEAIIFEDDAIVPHEFKKIISTALAKVPKRKEIVFFAHGKGNIWPVKKKLPERYYLVRYRIPSRNSLRFITNTSAYYITLEGAKKLLKQAYPIRMPADYLTGLLQRNKLKAYGIEPSCVFSGVQSEIDNMEKRIR
ncbi:glycosyltransferase family 25 protein [Basilea psittacipulmonis]|uniref:Beta-1,4-galactosyltransferase n=1 Tax=Basilea psittacipulmonis DSM 24701 TaxID=1072685 RepID=A0A077DFM0_9BURK|nr:glycosyltransferase family 25 protein [Basilea psittacipulmonis]AIL31963.1 beta-1,4-galactosyltransferase [Basilea psittacipulmonis DSM 24701]